MYGTSVYQLEKTERSTRTRENTSVGVHFQMLNVEPERRRLEQLVPAVKVVGGCCSRRRRRRCASSPCHRLHTDPHPPKCFPLSTAVFRPHLR